MCYRTANGLSEAEIVESLRSQGIRITRTVGLDSVRSNYNVAPGAFQPVLFQQAEHGAGDHEPSTLLQAMKWGLVPHWSKELPRDYATLLRTANTRDDSLWTDGGMWASMKNSRRCVVVCQGYYEWLKRSDRVRTPYFTRHPTEKVLLLAGLYDITRLDKEQPLYTYSIITTTPSQQMSFLHDRMPAILTAEEALSWIDPSLRWCSKLQDLIGPAAIHLQTYVVPREVNKPSANSPKFILPVDSQKSAISHWLKASPEKKPASPSRKRVACQQEDADLARAIKLSKAETGTRPDEDTDKARADSQTDKTPPRPSHSAHATKHTPKRSRTDTAGMPKITDFFG